jgi:biopolymer transport protein ExbB/TolQ
MLHSLLAAFSGPASGFMVALLAVAAVGTAVAIDRAWVFARARADAADVLARAAAALAAPADGVDLGTRPLEQVVAAGVREARAGGTPESAWDAMTAAALDAEQQLRRRVGYLAVVASIATMLGLFGTVHGLMVAFGGLADTAAAERAARMSAGSATAMATTAFGLLVAIPSLAVHAVADAHVRGLLAGIEAAANRTMVLLARRSRATGA